VVIYWKRYFFPGDGMMLPKLQKNIEKENTKEFLQPAIDFLVKSKY
jgi:hypothetical protein